mmetsp:Transcript_20456/g.17817  ORF Transcript_20456/g.17817 Transcript_20456/m.17817 type:complete len:128 (-) Transcript_20456:1327-1710(-)
MIINIEGNIEGITEKICKNLRISPPSDTNKIHLREICVQFDYFKKALLLLSKITVRQKNGLLSTLRTNLTEDNLDFLDQFTGSGLGLDYKVTPSMSDDESEGDLTVYYNTIVEQHSFGSQIYFTLRL